MFDLVEDWQFRSGMRVHFNSSQVQRSHITWGWPLKTGFQNWNCREKTSFFFLLPLLWLAAFFREYAQKELGFGKQPFVMRTPPAGGLFCPLRPAGLLFFLSHAKLVEGSKISVGSNRKLRRGEGGDSSDTAGSCFVDDWRGCFVEINNTKCLNFRPSIKNSLLHFTITTDRWIWGWRCGAFLPTHRQLATVATQNRCAERKHEGDGETSVRGVSLHCPLSARCLPDYCLPS